jgi:diguanylate cyclase (GGDEF)-like protein
MSAPLVIPPEKSASSWIGTAENLPRPLLVVFGLCLVYFAGYLDYVTGAELSPQILYLIPVGMVAWCAGHNFGYLLAANVGLARIGSDWLLSSDIPVSFQAQWNAASQFVVALTFAHLLASLRLRLEKEQILARTDALTQINNARSFIECSAVEIERARRRKHSFVLAYLDCDGFKQINDHLGHATGDLLLQSVAATMKSSVRSFDVVARLGGDEFVILLPEVTAQQAQPILERVRERLLGAMRAESWAVTFSIGAVIFEKPPSSSTEMLRLGDDAMYRAKKGGKDRIVCEVYNGLGDSINASSAFAPPVKAPRVAESTTSVGG